MTTIDSAKLADVIGGFSQAPVARPAAPQPTPKTAPAATSGVGTAGASRSWIGSWFGWGRSNDDND